MGLVRLTDRRSYIFVTSVMMHTSGELTRSLTELSLREEDFVCPPESIKYATSGISIRFATCQLQRARFPACISGGHGHMVTDNPTISVPVELNEQTSS